MSLWIIDSLDSLKQFILSETNQKSVFMNESLNHCLTRFTQTVHSFKNESNDCLYEWVSESLTHSIHSNSSFIQKRIKWLPLWMSLWIIDSLDSLKQFILSETNQITVFMNESLNHWLDSFRNEVNAWCSSGVFVSVGFTRWPVTEEVYRVHTCRTTTLTALSPTTSLVWRLCRDVWAVCSQVTTATWRTVTSP